MNRIHMSLFAVVVWSVLLHIGAADPLISAHQTTTGQSPSPDEARLRFDVASVKANRSGVLMIGMEAQAGGRFVATNVTLHMLTRYAFARVDPELAGGPDWKTT